MQIRTRLTLLFLLLVIGFLAGVLLYVYWTFKRDTEEVFFQNLRSKATVAAQALLPAAESRATMPPTLGFEGDTLPYRDNTSLYNEAYERVFSAEPLAPLVSVKILQDVQRSGEERFEQLNLQALAEVVYTADGRPFVLVIEGFCDRSSIIKLRNILIISFLAGVCIMLAAGWYFAGQALRPVSRIINQVDQLSPANPGRRLDTGARRDEIGRLAETFNRLLDRVENAFRVQRMFLSNVSHELKNPLMAIRAQLDVTLQRERKPEAYRKALQSVLDDVLALSEVEETLLQLARIYNNPEGIPLTPVRLDELLWQVKENLPKRHPGYRATLEFGDMPESGEALVVQANEPLLHTALLNLLDNACKYAPDQRVLVRARFTADGAHEIAVCDNGPGIPPEEIALIFEPFFRGSRHRGVKGTGIGLALVRSILDLHRIGLDLANRPEGGAEFRLRFPAVV